MEMSSIRHRSVSATPSDNIVATTEVSGTRSRTDGNEYPFPISGLNVNSVVHQRRRVNPESLAMRLGPELVRDLDALITPGNTEMPSFTVRKELQERYNIDRRHIYDYFHSRGLRVVKEDKHGNPTTVRDFPGTSLPNLRPLRQAPIKNPRSHTPYPISEERKLFKPRGLTKAKPGRPKKNLSINHNIGPITRAANDSTEPMEVNDTPTYVTVNPLLPHTPPPSMVKKDDNCTLNTVLNPLDESFSVKRAIGDIAYAYRHKLVFERMQDDRLLSWNETSPCSASDKGLLLPHAKPLTRVERQTIYEAISDGLGPANGIQECQGTYRKHMQARAKLYFEGLLSVPYRSQQLARTSTLSDRKSLGTNEFRHWLSETRFLKHEGTNGSPRHQPTHRNTNTVKQQVIGELTDKQCRQICAPNWVQTLDDLFPTAGDNNSITDSPVIHAREVTRKVIAHARGAIDDCSAAVAETLQAVHAQLHGLSGFPGTQDIDETRVPFAELDRLQWPEHVPYIAPSGQQPTLSDTQRRSRNMSHNAQARLPSCSPRKHQRRDLDRIWTRAVTSHDARRRTPSAAGGI